MWLGHHFQGQTVKGQLVADVLNSQHARTGAIWQINMKILSTCWGQRHILVASGPLPWTATKNTVFSASTLLVGDRNGIHHVKISHQQCSRILLLETFWEPSLTWIDLQKNRWKHKVVALYTMSRNKVSQLFFTITVTKFSSSLACSLSDKCLTVWHRNYPLHLTCERTLPYERQSWQKQFNFM